jgi:phosphatidylserine/phosphatidylglycerophosphate/cardiolipin synthase-like enzyme
VLATRRLLVSLVLLALTATLAQPVSVAQAAGPDKRRPKWAPPEGLVLSDPMVGSGQRAILKRINRAIRESAKGEYIRIAVWNYDDRATTRSLLAADARGVHVQLVVAGSVSNPNWARTQRVLNASGRDRSFAVRCKGACRSAAKIMHSKFVLISRVHRAHDISMVGSFNITQAAGSRQWNDLVTVRHHRFYKSLVGTFFEYARDRPLSHPFQVKRFGRYKISLWPSYSRNQIESELKHVSCRVKDGNGWHRTKLRIAIAGWFDAFGYDIAKQVRRLWNRGCNIRIITTLAGRGVNQTLRNPKGRGPVPIRQVTVDNDLDGVPERYLHMKAIAIRGGFAGDKTANVLITGSPNWSTRASRSDEILFRFLNAKRLVGRYLTHVDRLYRGPWSHEKTDLGATLERRLATGDLPEWFELD